VNALVQTDDETLLLAKALNGFSSLHIACQHGYTQVVAKLLKASLASRLIHKTARTSLHVACRFGRAEIVALLLDAGGNALLHRLDSNGWSCLLHACRQGHADIVQQLLSTRGSEALLHLTSATGLSCLSEACRAGFAPAVTALLATGAELVLAAGGQLCLELTCAGGHREVVRLLVRSLGPALLRQIPATAGRCVAAARAGGHAALAAALQRICAQARGAGRVVRIGIGFNARSFSRGGGGEASKSPMAVEAAAAASAAAAAAAAADAADTAASVASDSAGNSDAFDDRSFGADTVPRA
jgi:hypothetical protein